MARLPSVTGVELIKVLVKIGFKKIRQDGSHVFLRHPDGRTTVVPVHPGEKMDRGLLNKIMKKDIGLTREEFLKIL